MRETLLNLRFRDLLLFLLVYETKKLSDAAAEMDISIPTAERKLNLLRDAFNDRLFTRGGAAGAFMVPTGKADAFYPVVKSLLSQWIDANQASHFRPEAISTTFRLAVNGHGLFFIPQDFFSSFAKRCPNAKLDILKPSADIFAMLRNGEADFGISYRGVNLPRDAQEADNSESSFHSMPVYTGSVVVVVRKGHPLEAVAAERPITRSDCAPYPQVRLVSKPRKYRTPRYLDQTLTTSGTDQKTQFSTPFFFTGPMILQGNDCTCICPEVVARLWEKAGFVSCLKADFLTSDFTLHLIWHDRTDTLPEYQFVRSLLFQR